MNSGSYLQRFQGTNSGASTPKDEYFDDNYSDTGSITQGRKLSLETNKRRRVMAMKIKENVEQEEKRRKEILAKRRQEQKIITEKFQRKRRSQSARKAQHQQGTLEDALQAVKNSGSDNKISLRRTGSFDSLQARIDPWAVEQDARKNRPNPWEIEQEVLIKNNHTYREKYGSYANKTTVVDKTPQSMFEKKLEKHQNSVLMQQQKQLQEFSKALEQAFDSQSLVNSNSNHSPRDSLEDGEVTYPLSKGNSSINSVILSENNTYRVLSCEDLDPEAVIQDPNLFLPLNKPMVPSYNPESTNGFIKHTHVNSNFSANETANPPLHNSSLISNQQPDLFEASSSKTNDFNSRTPNINDQCMEADTQSAEATQSNRSSKIPVPVPSLANEKLIQSQKTENNSFIKSAPDESEAIVRFVVVNEETEDNDDEPSRDSSASSAVNKPKGILKSLKAVNSDSPLLIHNLKGQYVRDSIEVAQGPSNSSNGKDVASANSTAREQKPKSVRFAENLEEDLEETFVRLCQLQDGDQVSQNGLPPRSLSAPVNRGRGKSSIKRNNAGSVNNTRPPRAPKRSNAPKMVSLFGTPVKLRTTRPQKITSSTLDRLANTINEEKEDVSARSENEEINNFNPFSNHIDTIPPDSLQQNANPNASAVTSNGGPNDLVFSQPSRIFNEQGGSSKIDKCSVENVDLSLSEQGDPFDQQNKSQNKDSPFDPTAGHTPTEAEIDQLWEHVRSCLKPTPAPDSATASDLSVISAPNSFRRQVTSPHPVQYRTNNAWTTEQQQNFKANQNRIQAQLSQGLRIIHHNSSAPAKRTPLSIQRDTRNKQHLPVNHQNQSSEKVTDSLAEFLNAERLCQSPGDHLHPVNRDDQQIQAVSRQIPQPPQNLLITRKRMVARQQMSPVSLTPVMSPVSTYIPQPQLINPISGPPREGRSQSAASQRGNQQSALSIEEERIMKSLERLNDRLNTVTN